MSIVQYPQVLAGEVGVIGALKYMVTTDNIATLTTAGYLNNIDLAVYPIASSDVISVIYNYNLQTRSGSYGLFTVSISNGTITLVTWANPGDVITPTIANHIATFTNTIGTIGEDAATAINGGNIQAGLSGTAGYVASFPGTAARGSLRLVGANNAGDTVTQITNASMGQASVITIPDPGAGSASFLLNAGANTLASGASIRFPKAIGTEVGGTVMINAQSGVMTTSALTTASGSSYVITWSNSFILSTSVVLITPQGGTSTVTDVNIAAFTNNGSCTLTIFNNSGGPALNGTLILGFMVV